MNTSSACDLGQEAAESVRLKTVAGLGDLSTEELRHDLRQPLAAVSLLVDMALSTTGVPPELLGTLSRIRNQADWMAELLRSTEEHQPAISVVDLADTVHGSCLATPAGVAYEVSFVKEDRTGVLVDPVGLKRSAWNLVDNARRAVAHGGTVEVRVSRRRRDAVLEVADSGPGFGRLESQQGHGLVGVRRFAHRFGGELSIGTSSLGGALVSLRLPLAIGSPVGCGR